MKDLLGAQTYNTWDGNKARRGTQCIGLPILPKRFIFFKPFQLSIARFQPIVQQTNS